MREIEGIEKVIESLKSHWGEIDARFNEENRRFIALFGRRHDVIGRLLKCHLVVEHYLERFLSDHFGIENVEDAKLGFYNKAALLPSKSSSAAFVKPGILRLNVLRNRIGHSLGNEPAFDDLGPIRDVLQVARQGVHFAAPIDAIEAFTTVACTWLIVPDRRHRKLFEEAFSDVRVSARPASK